MSKAGIKTSNFSIHHLWWIPITFLWYFAYGWISKVNNDLSGGAILWVILIGGLCPMWVVVSRISKNLYMDGLVFGFLMTSSYIAALTVFGEAVDFYARHWVGVAGMFAGIELLKSCELKEEISETRNRQSHFKEKHLHIGSQILVLYSIGVASLFVLGSHAAIHHLWWVPCTFLYYMIYTYFGVKNNRDKSWKSAILLYTALALCPFWAIVSSISKNLYMDGLLYDGTMTVSYLFTLWYLGEGSSFKTRHWLGVGLMGAGLMLIRT